MVQKCFCTPNEAMDPIMFIAGEMKEMPSVKFFLKHPVAITNPDQFCVVSRND